MIAVNLVPVSKGGGLQNSLSFLTILAEDERRNECICFVRKSSLLEKFCIENELIYVSFKDSFLGRACFELFQAKNAIKKFNVKIIFTLFGNCPVFSYRKIKISGFARSNIVEKDREFWNFLPIHKRMIKRFIDIVILALVRRSDVVILETERLVKIANLSKLFANSSVRLVQMAPSGLINNKLEHLPSIIQKSSSKIRILYLTGSHPNKKIHELAEVFYHLNKNYILVTTMADDPYFRMVEKEFEAYGVRNKLDNRGPILQSDIPNVIAECKAIINIAHLESFSNNWVEAWASNRLLICADKSYAKDSCFDSAIYIDSSNPLQSAKKINDTFMNNELIEDKLKVGQKILKTMPNAKMKYKHYFEVINEFI